MSFVITCGDEGVQINVGTRLAVVGAGINLPDFSLIVAALKKLLGSDLRVAASEENDWVKKELGLDTWEQTNASFQQEAQVLADREGLLYAGNLPFADPQELKHEIKGHMVRPAGVHIANSVCFTLDGGEQTYHLGQYLISAEWIGEVDRDKARELLKTQVDFYQSLSSMPLKFTTQEGGVLGEAHAAGVKALLTEFNYELG